MKQYFILLVFFKLSLLQSFAQVETRYYQTDDTICSIQDYLLLNRKTDVIRMPAFDLAKMQKEDSEMEGIDVPYRFGKGFDVSYTLSDGQWQDINEGRLWTLTFESEGAISLNYIFENMFLPDGAILFIVNQDKTVVYGPVTSEVTVPMGSSFLTDIIPGSSSTIYLYEPLAKINESTLTIKRVVHGYRGISCDLSKKSLGDSNDCNIDVACYPNYAKESEGVALVLLSTGYEWCSGSLLMSADISFVPYFLTAFHCIDLDENHVLSDYEKFNSENWMFKFCFKKTSCNGSSIVTNYTYNKADFCSAWSNTDFALLKLNPAVSQNSLLTWLGWDKSSNTPTNGACIHHPQGDVMKISIENDQFGTSCSHLGNYGWDVNFENGIVEGGSSGSPVLNQDKRVVGQLWGGLIYSNPCYQTNGQYGKFYQSWIGGGSNDTRLSNWLDPNGTNLNTIDSSKPISFSGPTIVAHSGYYTIDNLPNSMSVTWSINNNAFSVLSVGNHCDVTYDGTNDYDTAVLTVAISYNGNVVKTLTKEIYHIEDIDGEVVLCDQENYSINDLPNNFSVTWSINNSNFTITPSSNQCFVSYIGTPQYDVANLSATITKQGQTIGNLTKRIVMHGTDLLVDGWQIGTYSPNGTYPDVEFTIPNNRTSPSRAKLERLLEEDLADKESLPIEFTRDLTYIQPDTPPVDSCGYGFTEIYGGNMVYLNSDRFDGMNISFSGPVSPTYLYRSESNGSVIFNLPYQNSVYYTTLRARSDDHCHDFCLSFKVQTLPGAASGDDEICVDYTGSMLYITFLGSIGTPMPNYSVTITKIPVGTIMYSNTFPGYENYFSVNTSSWTSGIYSIRIVQNGHIYNKTFCI